MKCKNCGHDGKFHVMGDYCHHHNGESLESGRRKYCSCKKFVAEDEIKRLPSTKKIIKDLREANEIPQKKGCGKKSKYLAPEQTCGKGDWLCYSCSENHTRQDSLSVKKGRGTRAPQKFPAEKEPDDGRQSTVNSEESVLSGSDFDLSEELERLKLVVLRGNVKAYQKAKRIFKDEKEEFICWLHKEFYRYFKSVEKEVSQTFNYSKKKVDFMDNFCEKSGNFKKKIDKLAGEKLR